MNVLEIGPMVGGGAVDLGVFSDTTGRQYVALLQYGGEVPAQGSSASKVDGQWVKDPPWPSAKHPVVTLMPTTGGPRGTFAAAVIVDLARCNARFDIPSLWPDEGATQFPAQAVACMGAQIERLLPDTAGRFLTCWIAPDAEGAPF